MGDRDGHQKSRRAAPRPARPPRRRVSVFANPAAGRTGQALAAAVEVLRSRGVSYRCHWPPTADALRQGIGEAAGRVDAVVVAGGDGTVNAALPALLATGVPLALLPVGTANDLARTLGLPLDARAAAEVAVHGAVRAVDLARVNGRLFCNVAHLGLGVHAHSEGLSPGRKRRWGSLSYAASLARGLRRLKSFDVEVAVDGRRTRLRSLHFSVGNGRFYGGGVPVQAHAAIDDGLLDAYSVPPQGTLGLVRAAWDVWRGGLPGAVVWRATGRELVVRTRRPRRIMADGEYIAWTPATFQVCPGALHAVVPEDAPAPGVAVRPGTQSPSSPG